MSDDTSFQAWLRSQSAVKEGSIDLRKVFVKMLSNWYYVLCILLVAFACAGFYNNHTTPIYNVSTTLLIEESEKLASNTDKILEGFGLGQDMRNIDNQILILSSYTLIGRALDELPFDIDYYYNGCSLYPDHPIRVVPEKPGNLPLDIEFTFTYLHDNIFKLDAKSDTMAIQKLASFGEIIKTSGGNFRVERLNDKWFSDKDAREIHFIFYSRNTLLESYSKRLKVETVSKKSTIVRISVQGGNKIKEMDFLNKLTEVFQNITLEKKNKKANRTILFIDNQLVGITDSLVITENKLQQFRSKNKVMDLSVQGRVIIDQAMKLENEKANLVLESNYYKYLAEYLKKDNIDEIPIAPAIQGITDPGLTRLVTELADLQDKYYSIGLGEKNPMKSQLAQRLRNTKDALMETLYGVRKANELAMQKNNEQICDINTQASALPMTERQLLGIERKFKLNDVLYTFLLEKRAEAQIQKASNTSDNELVDPARPDSEPVSPKNIICYMTAMIAGLGLPFLWIWLMYALNNRITDEDDIKKITDLPIAGHIPHSFLKTQNIVFEEQNSIVAESFRSLRTKIRFFTRNIKVPVILITSSIPGEGKTYTAINLASVFSIMGKKTVLIGLDLRRPNIYYNFRIINDKGVSTWLIGRDKLDEVINKTPYANLDIIPAGVIPPNPAELIASEKTAELFSELKKRYDYIIVNSAPLGSVSDAYSLVAYADTILLVVRDNDTFKQSLKKTVSEIVANEITNISILENDINQAKLAYRYRFGHPLRPNIRVKGIFQFLKKKR